MDKRFLELVRSFKDLDISSTPGAQFAKALGDKLRSYDTKMYFWTIRDIICCLDIQISEFDENNPDWQEVIEIYADLIIKLYNYYCIAEHKHRLFWVFSKVSIKY